MKKMKKSRLYDFSPSGINPERSAIQNQSKMRPNSVLQFAAGN